jgi:nucleoside-diphosphate-sugar epimerase
MRCLITGVAGFIGSHLAERLLAEGHEVWGIDSFTPYYARILKEYNVEGPRNWERFTLLEKDLLTCDLKPLLDGMDWIFHLAAQTGVRASWGQDFGHYNHCNIQATQRLLDASVGVHNVKRFIYASSSSVYGQAKHLPLQECMQAQPYSPYGVTKLAAEHLCMAYHHNYALPVVALRYFTVYGPRQRPDMALHRFCQAIVEHTPLHIFGNGNQTRDFTFVSDIVEANLRAATAPTAVGEVLNIASGTQTTLRAVLDLLQEISDTPLALTYEQPQRGDVQDTLADIARATHVLGYTPQVSLRDGIAQQFAFLTQRYERVAGAGVR